MAVEDGITKADRRGRVVVAVNLPKQRRAVKVVVKMTMINGAEGIGIIVMMKIG